MRNGNILVRFVLWDDDKRKSSASMNVEMGSPPRTGEEVTLLFPTSRATIYYVTRLNWTPGLGDIDVDIFLIQIKEAS